MADADYTAACQWGVRFPTDRPNNDTLPMRDERDERLFIRASSLPQSRSYTRGTKKRSRIFLKSSSNENAAFEVSHFALGTFSSPECMSIVSSTLPARPSAVPFSLSLSPTPILQ